jgi:hypothetical protein
MKVKRELGIITVNCECGREIVFRLKRGNGFEILSEKTQIEQQKTQIEQQKTQIEQQKTQIEQQKTQIEQQKTEKEPKIKIKFPWSYD